MPENLQAKLRFHLKKVKISDQDRQVFKVLFKFCSEAAKKAALSAHRNGIGNTVAPAETENDISTVVIRRNTPR